MADLSAPTSAPASHPTPRRLPAAKAARIAQLHRACHEDYEQAAARRSAQDHRDDAHLIAAAAEAVNAR